MTQDDKAQEWWASLQRGTKLHSRARILLKLLRPSRTMPEAMTLVYQLLHDITE